MPAMQAIDYTVRPATSLPYEEGLKYWKDLKECGRLDLRICDVVHPTMEAVHKMLWYNGRNLYYVLQGQKIVGEFMLNNFTGKAAQIHFSLHPDLHMKDGVPLVTSVVNDILRWKVNGSDEQYLHTLFGLTPVANRAACIVVLKVGFEKKGILPKGMWFLGKPVDAMFSVKTV